MSMAEILVHVTRGPLIECAHRGHAAVTDANGSILYEIGDPCHVTYARSAMKPIQALPVLESGAADRYRFSDEELALLCASHNGEEPHTGAAASMLQKLGLSSGCLLCGPHAPFRQAAADALTASGQKPSELHNNCSGKHAGMLALCKAMDAPLETYMEPEHPVQQLILSKVSSMTGVPAEQLILGTDGCGVPVFGLPLHRLAAAFAKLGVLSQQNGASVEVAAAKRIVGALRSHPFQLAGTDRYDTRLIEATGGRIIGKMGAEGVFALTLPEQGLGLALKVEDGAQRALYPAITEALMQLGWLSAAEAERLSSFRRPVQRNWKGTPVGELIPVLQLRPSEALKQQQSP